MKNSYCELLIKSDKLTQFLLGLSICALQCGCECGICHYVTPENNQSEVPIETDWVLKAKCKIAVIIIWMDH